ncbi:MAG TPA: prenyltransferase/squalene oxidase repeat-containing protein, partial [Rhodocyclaceae bacterium]|nr:prenyltransferase/squalene oxidase repeat-containing protein [Rhodocyclaceae bacterium]
CGRRRRRAAPPGCRDRRDGGIPTFCRGWGNLPFDRSSTDITAHAMRAWMTWRPKLGAMRQQQIDAALQRAWGYLQSQQRPDGSWVPLWFGNEAEGQEENPAHGTSRVLSALCELSGVRWAAVPPRVSSGLRWLLGCQTTEGGFGGAPGLAASVEETALVVEVLGKCLASDVAGHNEWPVELPTAWARGVNWLLSRVETGEWRQPSPIGFYFAKLWYYERLYPQIFTVAALGAASEVLCGGNATGFGADASRGQHRAH